LSLYNFLIIIILILFLLAVFSAIAVIVLHYLSITFNQRTKQFAERWEESFFDYLSSDKDPDDLINQIPKSNYKYLLEFIKPLLINLRGDDYIKFSKLIYETSVYKYLISSLKSRSKQRKMKAAYFLGLSRAAKAKDILIANINSKDELVIISVSLALARLNAVDSADYILKVLRKRTTISNDTLYSILVEFDKEICSHLLRTFKKENLHSKIIIISVFRHFKFLEAAETALKELSSAQEKTLIIALIKFLSEVGYKQSEHKIKYFRLHNNPDVRKNAVVAYGKIASPGRENKIVELINDRNWGVQLNAAEALWKYSQKGKELLNSIACSLKDKKAASAARMILSYNTIFNK
jgi:HEAT repeat protein